MRQQIVSKTGTGSSQVIPMNLNTNPFNVGFGVVVTGTVNYTVQHTFDNPWDAPTTTWFSHPTVAAATTSQDGNYAFPVAAIKVLVNSGAGTATLTVIQAGIA
jgi:hypothetical protein